MAWMGHRCWQLLSIDRTWYGAIAAVVLPIVVFWWLRAVIEASNVGFVNANAVSKGVVLATPFLWAFLQPVAFWAVYVYFVHFVPAFILHSPAYKIDEMSAMTFTVWPWSCDPNMHLNNSVYSWLADLAWFRHMHRFGYFKLFIGEGVSPVIGSQVMRFRAELPILCSSTVETRLSGWDQKYLYYEIIFKRGGRAACVLLRKVMLIDTRAKNKQERKLTPKQALERLARTVTWDDEARDAMIAEIHESREPSEAMQKLLQSSDALLSPD